MAIEFHCPQCSAVMRVPDQFAGKQGRCPKCQTVVVVPDVRPPEVAAADEAVRPASSFSAEFASELPTEVRPPGPASVTDATDPLLPDAAPPFLVTPATQPSIARSLKKRRRSRGSQRVWLVGVPSICFLLLLGAIAWYMVNRLPSLSGDITGVILASDELPPAMIPWSMARELTDDERAALQNELELDPEAFLSSQMTCRMTASEDGVEVRLKTTGETAWYVVNAGSHPALLLWLRKNRDRLTGMRNLRLQTAFQEYCRQKLRVINGDAAVIDAQQFRDSVGLEACCGGFGSVVQAVVLNRAFRCASEDESGRIYFCLPRGIVSFELRGITLPDGSQPFGGHFRVRVTDTMAAETTESLPAETQPAESGETEAPGKTDFTNPAAGMESSDPETENPGEMTPLGFRSSTGVTRQRLAGVGRFQWLVVSDGQGV